jgi:hypothetical protein
MIQGEGYVERFQGPCRMRLARPTEPPAGGATEGHINKNNKALLAINGVLFAVKLIFQRFGGVSFG